MNKPSELSKPVAWKLHHHDRYYFEENADVVAIAESFGQAKGDAVYSQEYVSALLAELEAKDKRIAELEYDLKCVIADNEDCEKTIARKDAAIDTFITECDDAQKIIAELKAKLATPVRLQSPWVDKVGNRWLLEGTTADAIRASGFAVTVEGDE